MDERNRAMIVVILLFAEVPAKGHMLDVCATCHANAHCDDKLDGSGKVCNCKYGFVGNGITYCQDKDECQIGDNKICGQHTTCQNTYGSYYCTCLAGYSPSNNMSVFIPNDGTHCQDIDECSIAGSCGAGAQCRNLEGSFDCSCQLGHQVHNGVEPFHPARDNASCKVVDCGPPASVEDTELRSVTGTTYSSVATFVCDEGFVWRSGANSSVCGADGRWEGPNMVCEEAVCGSPPVIEYTEQVWDSHSTPGSTVLYVCKEGFYYKGGLNISMCNENAQWTPPTLSCQDVLCGDPPTLPHTGRVWNGSSSLGSTVIYDCNIGFYHREGNNMSLCSINGYWTKPNISCKEVDCGVPPPIPHSIMLWDQISTLGSQVVYQCNSGYRRVGEGNVSACTASGDWVGASLLCQGTHDIKLTQWSLGLPDLRKGYHAIFMSAILHNFHDVVELNECSCSTGITTTTCVHYPAMTCCLVVVEISCQEPVFKPRAKTMWDGTSHIGTVVHYQCEEGYYTSGLRNYSVCGENGLWEDIDLWCEEVSCGPPLTLPHTNLGWDGTSRPGSVVLYECVEGFYQMSGNNISTCLLSGQWGKVSVKCKAKCGPIPIVAQSEVMWHNRSVVIYRCVDGYHSWRGSYVSVCGSSGEWLGATLRCIEIKPPVNHLSVLNEKCLHWRAEKYEEDEEVYKVTYVGSRDYERSFHDRGKRRLSSKADQLELCLNLLPVTNYSISITALSSRFTATISTNTSLTVPPAPVVYYREFETPVPTLRLRRSPNTLDTIGVYQVFVLPVEGVVMFDCSSPVSSGISIKIKSSTEYITAQIDVGHIRTDMNFTVGDGLYYGGFFNAPLENGRNYYIILRAVSRWKSTLKSSCVLWAKVKGTSYVLRVSSLCAAASIGLVALVLLGGYCFTWYGRWC
ncbi:sushi domain-containing protein 1 isoform X3 [Pseudoliparis swirei]|uniref:sushi domain-containing protein 1 isoform X3 n=1 Tax=Pseudoliparis swirei TaxID=2059687 RepID=UPI0024BDA91C|nr:sushi domain-containing protein 1 isoform X3 [Pseudoliparis swirei]